MYVLKFGSKTAGPCGIENMRRVNADKNYYNCARWQTVATTNVMTFKSEA